MNELIKKDRIAEKIYLIRGAQVMLDRDLAEIYGVETKVFNQAVKRNLARFPEEFRFQILEAEYVNLRSQFVTSNEDADLRSQNTTSSGAHGGRRYPSVEIVPFQDAHDRFLILDSTEVYHIGASLKDLGKKWFAFSKIEKDAVRLLERFGDRS